MGKRGRIPVALRFFLHRLSGGHEPRRRFALTGGEFFAEPQRGSAPSADGGDVAAPAAVGKRVDTYGFYPLNSRFPLFLSLAKIGERRPLRKRERQRIFFTVGAHIVRPFLYLYAVSDTLLLHIPATFRRRDISVSRNSFAQWPRTAPANTIWCKRYLVGRDDLIPLFLTICVCLHTLAVIVHDIYK